MEKLLVVMQVVALAALSALCVYLIVVLARVRDFLSSVERDIRELSAKAIPVFDDLGVITRSVKNVVATLDGQIETIRKSIDSIREVFESVVNLERRIQTRLEEPVLGTVAFVSAVFKGVRTFFERVRG